LLDVLREADTEQLKRNAYHVLDAIPDIDTPTGLMKFAAVHHVIGSAASACPSLAHTCIVGKMSDQDAREFVMFLLERGWIAPYPGLLLNACANNKPQLAQALHAKGVRITHSNWASFLSRMGPERIVQMAQLYFDTVHPDRAEVIAMRLAAAHGSPLPAYLDKHLGLVVDNESARIKH
jgi:hypothetical protein